MARITYEQALSDHDYLWEIAPADDMTGGYEDQNDLARLLRSPTKATARDCLCSQIEYWFFKGPDSMTFRRLRSWRDLIPQYPRLVEIAERHDCADDDEQEGSD